MEWRNLPKLQVLSCVGSSPNVVDSSTPLRSGRNDKGEAFLRIRPLFVQRFTPPRGPHQARPGEPASPERSSCTVSDGHTDQGCTTTTATGTTVRRGTVAVDPRYIPYGTRMFIVASDGSFLYGLAQAEDCGGDIKGDRMDLYFPTFEDCITFGRRRCTVYFLG